MENNNTELNTANDEFGEYVRSVYPGLVNGVLVDVIHLKDSQVIALNHQTGVANLMSEEAVSFALSAQLQLISRMEALNTDRCIVDLVHMKNGNTWTISDERAILSIPEEAVTNGGHDIIEVIPLDSVGTYGQWLAKALQVLKGRPDWTALKDPEQHGFVVMYKGDIYAAPEREEGYLYTEDDLLDFNRNSWDDFWHCWEGSIPRQCRKVLFEPIFTTLKHESEPVAPVAPVVSVRILGGVATTSDGTKVDLLEIQRQLILASKELDSSTLADAANELVALTGIELDSSGQPIIATDESRSSGNSRS